MLIGALPGERMHVGHRLTGFTERGDKIEAQFENGARVTADALIGADGIHSTVQQSFVRRRAARASPAASPIAGWCRPSG